MSRLPVLAERSLKPCMFLLSVVRRASHSVVIDGWYVKENPLVAFRIHVVNNACKRPFSVLMMEPTRLIQIFPMDTHCTIHTLLSADFEPYRYFT
ncbi:hypothetical protein F5148DRAFT_1229234 [Russula earlei]|uniref:Uncharacterized protein n=1 Tax=Russula earlei TaxID=71964 RepID=A0ACC0TZB9_9AGAM|nr:hypothetical protein F5148DRAFT_1229234 [Russula earlei]